MKNPASFALVLALVSAAQPVRAADAALAPPMQLVSDVPELAHSQVQSPLWAPGPAPRLVHEITDRSRRTVLRVVDITGAQVRGTMVPGSSSSRLESLGAGGDRADTEAAWWDGASFFFVRSVQGSPRLYYFDGVPREVSGVPGRIDEVAVDPQRSLLFAALEDSAGLDVYNLGGSGFTERKARLSRSPGEVEHALQVEPSSGALHFIATARDGTRLGVANAGGELREPTGMEGLARYEFLSLSTVPGADVVLVYARVPGDPAKQLADSYVLLEVSGMRAGSVQHRLLAQDVYLPPGVGPRPAISHAGKYVYYVAANAAQGNPVMRVDRAGGKAERLTLPTRGHQEVSVGEYADASGVKVPWLAVVSVGDESGEDVRNHLWVGPMGTWEGCTAGGAR
jgi:hypothetical protein